MKKRFLEKCGGEFERLSTDSRRLWLKNCSEFEVSEQCHSQRLHSSASALQIHWTASNFASNPCHHQTVRGDQIHSYNLWLLHWQADRHLLPELHDTGLWWTWAFEKHYWVKSVFVCWICRDDFRMYPNSRVMMKSNVHFGFLNFF